MLGHSKMSMGVFSGSTMTVQYHSTIRSPQRLDTPTRTAVPTRKAECLRRLQMTQFAVKSLPMACGTPLEYLWTRIPLTKYYFPLETSEHNTLRPCISEEVITAEQITGGQRMKEEFALLQIRLSAAVWRIPKQSRHSIGKSMMRNFSIVSLAKTCLTRP